MKHLFTGLALFVLMLGCISVARPTSSVTAAETSLLLPAEPAAIYSENCSRCHGEDGRAQTKKGKQLRATDFTDPKWQRGITDAKGIRVIANGHEDMPAFKDTLSADQIKEMMVYVRRFRR